MCYPITVAEVLIKISVHLHVCSITITQCMKAPAFVRVHVLGPRSQPPSSRTTELEPSR